MTHDTPDPPAPVATVPVLGYGEPAAVANGRRWAVAASLWSFLSPFTVAGAMFLMVEGLIDIDDLLPRSGALAVIGAVGLGIPFAGVLAGAAAAARAATRAQKWLAVAAIVLGLIWCAAALILFVLVSKA